MLRYDPSLLEHSFGVMLVSVRGTEIVIASTFSSCLYEVPVLSFNLFLLYSVNAGDRCFTIYMCTRDHAHVINHVYTQWTLTQEHVRGVPKFSVLAESLVD